MARFQDQTVLVTGGTSGIGLATVERLLSEGARVAATGSNAERLKKLADDRPGVLTIEADNADPASAQVIADAVRGEFGQLDAAFLNAGFGRFVPLEEITADEFDTQYAVNVRGPLLQAKALAPLIKDGGAIVFNTSVAQDLGMPGGAIYNSTKGALRTIVRVLARELSGRGVRVNAVSPGPIGTDFFNRAGLGEEEQNQFAEQILSQVPLGRFGEPREIAAAAAFLLSGDASYVTGAEFAIDGGMTQL